MYINNMLFSQATLVLHIVCEDVPHSHLLFAYITTEYTLTSIRATGEGKGDERGGWVFIYYSACT